MTSILPMSASVAAIPDQILTLTFSPTWTSALFAAALVLTCGVLWLLRNLENSSRAPSRKRAPLSLAFPGPAQRAVAGQRTA